MKEITMETIVAIFILSIAIMFVLSEVSGKSLVGMAFDLR